MPRVSWIVWGLVAFLGCATPEYKPLVGDAGAPSGDGAPPAGDGGPISTFDGSSGGPPPSTLEVFSAGIADPARPGSALILREIAVDAANVFVVAWATGSPSKSYLLKTPIASPSQTTSIYASDSEISGLAIDAQLAYVHAGPGIVQVPLTGGAASTFHDLNGTPPPGWPIAANADHVYWVSTNQLNGKPKTGGLAAPIQQTTFPNVNGPALIADQDTLYWFGNNGIVRTPTSGSGPISTAANVVGSCLAADATHLYYLTAGSTIHVDAVLKGGGIARAAVDVPYNDSDAPIFLAVDPTYVWWTTRTGRIDRAKKL